MDEHSTTGTVHQGKFLADDKQAFKWLFYRNEGRRIKVTVKLYREPRSLEQNSYYWAVVVAMIGKYVNEPDPKKVHEMLKLEFNYRSFVDRNDKEWRIPLTTTEKDTAEFNEYVERVRRYVLEEWGLFIPDPDPHHGEEAPPAGAVPYGGAMQVAKTSRKRKV